MVEDLDALRGPETAQMVARQTHSKAIIVSRSRLDRADGLQIAVHPMDAEAGGGSGRDGSGWGTGGGGDDFDDEFSEDESPDDPESPVTILLGFVPGLLTPTIRWTTVPRED